MRLFALAALTAALLAGSTQAADKLLKSTVTGKPDLKGIDVISFGPQGTLLIGDGKGSQVIAIDTKDTTAKAWKAGSIAKINEKIAGKLGTMAKNIEFVHLAVNKASGTAYVAVRKQDEKKVVIVTIDGDGKIGEFSLDKVEYVAVPLPKGEKAAVSRVTDVAWMSDRLLVGAVCSEEFACKVYSIPVPLDPKGTTTGFSADTFHVQHNRWETKAPMTTLMPLEHKGKKYVIGALACTPVVRYSLDGIKAGAKVKGESVAELGSGNQPLNMFSYEKGGKSYLLINTYRFHHKRKAFGPSPYWTARLDLDVLTETKVNKDALRRINTKFEPVTDRIKLVEAYHGVVHLDRLDDKQALVIKNDAKTGWSLAALDLP